jgi:hypothetical protein
MLQLNTEKNNIIKPNKENSFIWFNVFFLIALLLTDYVNAFTIIAAYFLETFIIGVIHVLKMFKIATYNNEKYGLIGFFIIHYSFFIFLQLVFVFVILQYQDPIIEEPLYLAKNIKYLMSFKGMKWILFSQIIFNLFDYLFNFIGNDVYKSTSNEKYLTQPYPRIFVQQLAVIIGFFLLASPFSVLFLALLIIIIRSLMDFYLVSKSKKRFQNSQ